MNRRDQIRMTESELAAYLEEQRTVEVATIDHDGFPHLVAMWYTLIDGKIAFWTYGKSQKAVNLRRDPRLTCLVESGTVYSELRGVQIKGYASLTDDTETVQRIGERIYARYNGSPLSDELRQLVAAQAPKRIIVTVEPVEVVSWDHRKLGGIH